MSDNARVETVLPSWRFLLSEKMKAEADEFRTQWQHFPMYGHREDLRKLAEQMLDHMHARWPLISWADAKLDDAISQAIVHLGEGDADSHQPGYMSLMAGMFDDASRSGHPDLIRKRCRDFIDYRPHRSTSTRVLSRAEKLEIERKFRKMRQELSPRVQAKIDQKKQYVDY